MTFLEELIAFLLAEPDVAAAVGDRIFPVRLPQTVTLPALTVSRISNPRERSHSGFSNYATPRIQITAWGETYTAAYTAARPTIAALESYRGPFGTVTVYSSFVENELDLFDPVARLYMIPIDVRFSHKESL